MEQRDIWKREMPPLPFTIQVYRDSLASYMVFAIDGTELWEPIENSFAMSVANQLRMVKRQAALAVAE